MGEMMDVRKFPRTGDAIRIIITDDDGKEHRFFVWEDHGDDGAKGIALAIERVKERAAHG